MVSSDYFLGLDDFSSTAVGDNWGFVEVLFALPDLGNGRAWSGITIGGGIAMRIVSVYILDHRLS